MKIHSSLYLISWLVFLSGCSQLRVQSDVDFLYQQAVIDAMQVEEGENVPELTTIRADNINLVRNEAGDIKVVTWKSQSAFKNYMAPYRQTSDNPEFAYWVTVAPQVANFCREWLARNNQLGDKEAALNLRLIQLLGLHASWQYDVFVEMWVDPDDLFRPCVDPAVNDNQCDLFFSDQKFSVDGIEDYVAYFDALYKNSFRTAPGVPWTGLGYTYDWANNGTSVGLSEFITKPEAEYQVIRAVPTVEYCSE